jgi:hypothetical protein
LRRGNDCQWDHLLPQRNLFHRTDSWTLWISNIDFSEMCISYI